MDGMLKLNESITLPRGEYEALRRIAESVLDASRDITKVSFPLAMGYLIDSYRWERIEANLREIVVPIRVVAVEESEEQSA